MKTLDNPVKKDEKYKQLWDRTPQGMQVLKTCIIELIMYNI